MVKIVGSFTALLLVFGATSSLPGCKQQAEEANAPSVSASAVPRPATTIEEIIIANSDESSSMDFAPLTPKDNIDLILKMNVPSKGGSLEVSLFDIGNGRKVGLQEQFIPSDHAGTIELNFESVDEWTPGRYMLEVKIDGKLAGQRDFDITDFQPPSEQS